ncbi:MAG: hypothetical protein PQJ44_07930 [Sphaerochaetaceae bacterium]|nr:hypothetical protein [Sphaerochaetaceae bacterium]
MKNMLEIIGGALAIYSLVGIAIITLVHEITNGVFWEKYNLIWLKKFLFISTFGSFLILIVIVVVYIILNKKGII